MASKADRAAGYLIEQKRIKVSEAVLAGKVDANLDTDLTTARSSGWTWSQRTTKGTE